MSFSSSKEYFLSDLYSISSGLSKGSKEFGFGYPFLTFKEVFDNFFLPVSLKNLANTTDNERMRCSIRKGDIFLTRTSETQNELGMSSVALEDYDKATFNGFTKRLRPKVEYLESIDPVYMAYYMRSPIMRAQINSLSIMTTRASLNNSMIEKLRVELPDIKVQNSIGIILKTLDEKIEVNNQINKTLENIAQTIFKQWFVDFEFPNGAKEPYKSSGGEMVESELGMIPKGWEVGNIYSIADIIYGAPFSSKLFNEEGNGLPLIRIRDLKSGNPQFYTNEKHNKATTIYPGDILIGMDAEFVPTIWSGEKAYLNQRVCQIKSNKDYLHDYFLYELIKPHMKFFEFSKVGTTVIHLGKSDIDSIKIVIPSMTYLRTYSNLINPIHCKIVNLTKENKRLAMLRDSLLPKLMSGEIRVPIGEN